MNKHRVFESAGSRRRPILFELTLALVLSLVFAAPLCGGVPAAFSTTPQQPGMPTLAEVVNPKDYGAIADGRSHPLSTIYGSLGAAQAVYPFITSLSQEVDYAAVKQASNLALGSDRTVGSYRSMRGSSTTTEIIDPDADYSPNSLAGQRLFLRYPNAFVDSRMVLSNTAKTITIEPGLAEFHNGPNKVCGFGQTFDCSTYAVGQSEHGYFNAKLNKAIYLPAGRYVFGNDTWLIRNASGARITGEGRTATILTSNQTVFATDGLWYSIIEGITFQTLTSTATVAVDIDGNVPGHPYDTRSVQGNTFRNDQFDGGNGSFALALCRLGGSNAQGESSFIEDHWMNADTAFLINGFNNLANLVLRGDMQNYNTGIYLVAGSVQVIATSFESTRGYGQVAAGGFDIHVGEAGVGEKIIVSGCRTESLQFFKGSSTQPGVLIGNVQGVAQPDWQPGREYSLNEATIQLFKVNGVKIYRLFRVTTPGVSSGVKGTTDIFSADTIGHTGYRMPANQYVGFAVKIIDGTGVGQTRVIASNTPTTARVTEPWQTIPDSTSIYTISRPPVWPGTGTLTDGTVVWTQTNFLSVDGTSINNTGAFTLLNNDFFFTSIAEWRGGDTVTLSVSADFTQPYFAHQTLTFLGDASGGSFTVTLPPAPIGQVVTVKKTDAGSGTITVAASGTTIDGEASIVIPGGSRGSLTLHYGGSSGYSIVGKSF